MIPLPPEIKSAEEFGKQFHTGAMEFVLIREIQQRDIAIWNAAIEKAAETCCKEKVGANKNDHPTDKSYDEALTLAEKAILNLKQKE